MDMEVQQRAVEYLTLPSLNKPELIEHVLESTPPCMLMTAHPH